MAALLSAGVSIGFDSIGCFRADLARACGAIPASIRRWHGVQVRARRLKEGRDFVVVRQSPYERHHDDDIFYFLEAIKICQRRIARKQIDLSLIQLGTLRDHGLQIIDGQVVRRNQLQLFPTEEFSCAGDTYENNHFALFSMLVPQRYNGVCILQRCTDGYIRVDKLCQAAGENWNRFENQLNDPKTRLGSYAQMLNNTPRSFKVPLVQTLKCDDPVFQGVWADSRIVRRIAEEVDVVLANLIEQWEIDLQERLHSLRENSGRVTKDHCELLQEALKKLDRQHEHNQSLLRAFHSLGDDIKSQYIFDSWNQKIQKYTEGAISTHLQYWKVFKQKPTKATYTKFPFVYVIIVYTQHLPEIFYVGQSTVQPYQRFSNHNGLKSVEELVKHGYKYEIRYFESERFEAYSILKKTETALQAALDPYWEHLASHQRDKIMQGEPLNGELLVRLLTKDELTMVS